MTTQEKELLLTVARILRNHLGDHANANFSDVHYDLRLLVQALQPYESNIVNLKPDKEKNNANSLLLHNAIDNDSWNNGIVRCNMTDIVDRIRHHITIRGGPTKDDDGNYIGTTWPMMLESADEIERLRGELSRQAMLVERAHKAIRAALLIAKPEWDFAGAHPHRAAVVRDLEAALKVSM